MAKRQRHELQSISDDILFLRDALHVYRLVNTCTTRERLFEVFQTVRFSLVPKSRRSKSPSPEVIA